MKDKDEKNVEITGGGIVCDNPDCDYKDVTVKMEDYPDWVNKPCPKCGENLLTQEDYDAVLQLTRLADFVNTLSPDQISKMGVLFGNEPTDTDEEISTDRVQATIKIHDGEIDIMSFKKIEEDDKEAEE